VPSHSRLARRKFWRESTPDRLVSGILIIPAIILVLQRANSLRNVPALIDRHAARRNSLGENPEAGWRRKEGIMALRFLRRTVRILASDRRGVTSLEYGIIGSVMVIALAAVLPTLGTTVHDLLAPLLTNL
jgi:Flp pilus assembly pilin Flp